MTRAAAKAATLETLVPPLSNLEITHIPMAGYVPPVAAADAASAGAGAAAAAADATVATAAIAATLEALVPPLSNPTLIRAVGSGCCPPPQCTPLARPRCFELLLLLPGGGSGYIQIYSGERGAQGCG